jgi:hypothetical protein
MPIIGTLASSVQKITGSFESIATFTATGGEANFTFSSIPQTYSSLQIRWIERNTDANNPSGATALIFNNDTGSNYNFHGIVANQSTVTAYGSASNSPSYLVTGWTTNAMSGSTTPANVFAVGIIDIIDYTSTTKFKTGRSINGWEQNSLDANLGVLDIHSALWRSTSAITSIKVTPYGPFAAGSVFSLYGIKGV